MSQQNAADNQKRTQTHQRTTAQEDLGLISREDAFNPTQHLLRRNEAVKAEASITFGQELSSAITTALPNQAVDNWRILPTADKKNIAETGNSLTQRSHFHQFVALKQRTHGTAGNPDAHGQTLPQQGLHKIKRARLTDADDRRRSGGTAHSAGKELLSRARQPAPRRPAPQFDLDGKPTHRLEWSSAAIRRQQGPCRSILGCTME